MNNITEEDWCLFKEKIILWQSRLFSWLRLSIFLYMKYTFYRSKVLLMVHML